MRSATRWELASCAAGAAGSLCASRNRFKRRNCKEAWGWLLRLQPPNRCAVRTFLESTWLSASRGAPLPSSCRQVVNAHWLDGRQTATEPSNAHGAWPTHVGYAPCKPHCD